MLLGDGVVSLLQRGGLVAEAVDLGVSGTGHPDVEAPDALRTRAIALEQMIQVSEGFI